MGKFASSCDSQQSDRREIQLDPVFPLAKPPISIPRLRCCGV
jgi:hypothetical protein